MKQLKYFGAYVITTVLSLIITFLAINRLVILSKITTNDLDIANAITTAIITQLIIVLLFTYITYHLILDSKVMYSAYKKEKRLLMKHSINLRKSTTNDNKFTSTCTLTHEDRKWLLNEPTPDGITADQYHAAWNLWWQEGVNTIDNFKELWVRMGNSSYGSNKTNNRLREEYANVLQS